ncbi:MAG: pitrilysin family protein [Pseudomonadota bacterium]
MRSVFCLARAGVAAMALASGGAGLAAGGEKRAAPTPIVSAEVPPIQYKERILRNGLRILSLRDTTTPNVSVSIWYGVGSKHDPDKRSGFAHLFEHILSRKTVNMPYNMINRLTEDVGGVRNASTSFDRTNYYETVPAQYLETMLWTHAERMARPVIDKEVFETERNVVKEELRQRVLAPPYGRLYNFAMTENGFDVLPHRRPVIGSIADLDAATLEDARAFHEAYYGPDTATLIVAGNFDEARLQAFVDRYFAAIPKRAKPISLAIKGSEPPMAPRRINATGPNVPLPLVGALYKVPGATHPDREALEVMAALLGRGETSRLYRTLVRTGKASRIDADLDVTGEAGVLAPIAILSAGQDVEAVAGALDAELKTIATVEVSDAELGEARSQLLSDALEERETFSGRAFELGEELVLTGDPKAADKRLAAIARVTKADVLRVAKRYLDPGARVEVRYTNGDGNPASWANPVPMPTFTIVPAAQGTANQLAAEGARQTPPGPGPVPAVAIPKIVETRLDNGARVVAIKTGSVPLATMSVVIAGGASTDPDGKAGLARFAANLATKGTATRTAEQIAAILERLGGSIAGGAGPDGTTFSITVPTVNLAQAAAVLSDVIRNASYPQAEFDLERKRAVDQIQVTMKDPGPLANMAMLPVLYGAAPYGRQSGGTARSLNTLSRADLVDYRQRWWHPANSSIIVTGGIDPAAGTALVKKLFGDWQAAGAAPEIPKVRAGQGRAMHTIVIDLPGAGQAAVIAAVRGVSRSDADYPSLLLANAVLGVGSNGRLFTEVRSKRALSYGAYSVLPARNDVAMLSASAQTKNETATEVAEIFLNEFKRLGTEPIDGDALDKRKAYVKGSYGRQMETGGGFNAIIAGLIQQGLDPGEAFALAGRLDAVKPEAATAVAARLVKPDSSWLVIAGDSAKFIDKLRTLRPDVVVIPADKLDLDSSTLGAVR